MKTKLKELEQAIKDCKELSVSGQIIKDIYPASLQLNGLVRVDFIDSDVKTWVDIHEIKVK